MSSLPDREMDHPVQEMVKLVLDVAWPAAFERVRLIV